MRIAILWSGISGYVTSCWRSLASRSNVELKVFAYDPSVPGTSAKFDSAYLTGELDLTLLGTAEREDANKIRCQLVPFKPDVILVSGWLNKAYVKIVSSNDFKSANKIMGIDHGWDGAIRQRIACVVKRSYVKQFDTVLTAGERSFQYARRLRGSEEGIIKGLYAYDEKLIERVAVARPKDSDFWPRKFLYVGRYAKSKGLDTLLEGYAEYRNYVDDPWELHVCGGGPLKPILSKQCGVVDHGFVQPKDLPEVLGASGIFVIASDFEPWGVVIAEALGSGMPVIASHACGASADLIHPMYNGAIFATGNASDLARAMARTSRDRKQLVEFGKNAILAARPYASSVWVDRFLSLCEL